MSEAFQCYRKNRRTGKTGDGTITDVNMCKVKQQNNIYFLTGA